MSRALSRWLRSVLRPDGGSIRFTGDYETWEDAERDSTGYSAPEILEKTRAAALKVKSGHAEFERDSVAFDHVQYEFPLLAGLLRAATAADGRLSVLDFGGSLGSTYFQSRKLLSTVKDLHWSIVDQPAQVACGKKEFATEQLHFYPTIADCLAEQQPNLLLLSGVIQYLREPYVFLQSLLHEPIPQVIVERTAFNKSGRDRLTIQHVPARLYDASYPAWFLSEANFRKIFGDQHDLIWAYVSDEKAHPEGGKAVFKGFHFERKPQA
ncbi:MAG TPA: methyltransferase, TIGR04325 family [Chthoniobacterales bacterium]|nr:methyltransferase, TIGR04325 family [Chthoniobacterales bacterium]